MHLSHYDQISDIISSSFTPEEVFIHAHSDLILDNWQFREFSREYGSVKETSRLNNAGLPQVILPIFESFVNRNLNCIFR